MIFECNLNSKVNESKEQTMSRISFSSVITVNQGYIHVLISTLSCFFVLYKAW